MRRWRRRLGFLLLLLLVLPPITVVGATLAYRVVQPPITPLQVIRLLEGHGLEREVRPLDRISPHLARAVIASEDNLFCRHRGIDWAAFEAEWNRWRRGERPRGASTISMQLTKNLFLWPRRDHARKALELTITPVIDGLLSKQRILEIYLNQVEFAPGVYGAQAAARHHFGKDADRLSPREAALLAALLPAPLSWQPSHRRVQQQADRVQRRIGQLGPLLDCAPHP